MTQNNKLSKEWEIKKLGEVCDEIFAGGDVPKNNFSKVKNDEFQIPIYANGEKNLGLYGYTNIIKVNSPALTISGRGTIGFSVVRLKPFFPIVRLLVLKPNVNTNVKYLKYSIDNCNIKHTGSSIPQLTVPAIKSLKIPIPSLKSQEAIVLKIEELFSELDKGIQDLKTAEQQLKTYRQSILKWAFKDLISKKQNFKKLKDITSKIGSGSTPKGGSDNYHDSGIPLVRSLNIHFDYIKYKNLAFIDLHQAEKLKNVIINENDVLLNITGASIGRVNIAPKEFDNGRVNQHVSIIRPKNNSFLPKFLKYFIQTSEIQNWISNSNYGVTRQALTKSMLENLEIPLPKVEKQQLIIQEIENCLSVVDKMEESIIQSLEQAETLRQSILKKAFSGELV